MPENITAENLLNNIMDTISEGAHKQKSGSHFEEEISNHVASHFNRLFGRQEPVHRVLGGGKSADVLLWRNKKISSSVLAGATAIWVMFEWLNYHFLSLLCFAVTLGMTAQFLWSNASGFMKRSPSEVPRIQLPDEWFVNTGVAIGREVNRVLRFLQNIACSGNLKQFVLVVSGLVAAAIIGGWCNFLTVIYIGFVAAHTLPVLYEKYDDQIDGFIDNLLKRMTHHYRKYSGKKYETFCCYLLLYMENSWKMSISLYLEPRVWHIHLGKRTLAYRVTFQGMQICNVFTDKSRFRTQKDILLASEVCIIQWFLQFGIATEHVAKVQR